MNLGFDLEYASSRSEEEDICRFQAIVEQLINMNQAPLIDAEWSGS
jgi:hypothetical protein